ncbi:hypothetical protein, partial [Massilia sp. AB1]|uniref:hypothetical protein n=1 Tax=Massilia sp. AB1 TaxID=2823371 RepID=UPI001B829E28
PLAPSSNAHTYRLLIVKELRNLSCRLVDEALCSSAAEKRDYAVFCDVRQLLFLSTFHSHPQRSATALGETRL